MKFTGSENVKRFLAVTLFNVIYFLIIILVITSVNPNSDIEIIMKRKGGVYADLSKCETYFRRGFDPVELSVESAKTGSEWRSMGLPSEHMGAVFLVRDFEFLVSSGDKSMLSRTADEFTVLMGFEITDYQIQKIENGSKNIPGIFLSSIGNNYEIFINGQKIYSKIDGVKDGKIQTNYSRKNLKLAFSPEILNSGQNVVAFRILGSINGDDTGLGSSGKYYISNFDDINEVESDNSLYLFCGIYVFSFVYYFVTYVLCPEKLQNLFFGLAACSIVCFTFSETTAFHIYFADATLRNGIRSISLTLFVMFFSLFIDKMFEEKISPIAWLSVIGAIIYIPITLIFINNYERLLIQIYLFLFFMTSVFYYIPKFLRKVISEVRFARDTFPRETDEKKKLSRRIKKFFKVYFYVFSETPHVSIFVGILCFCIFAVFTEIMSVFYDYYNNSVSYSMIFIFVSMIIGMSIHFNRINKQIQSENHALENVNNDFAELIEKRTFELIMIQDELIERVEEAENANRAKSDFLAKMSHEIRTPMNAVVGLSELILREKISSRVREYADSVRHSGNNLISIINDILDFSKIEAGKMEIVNTKYNFPEMIEEVISMLAVRLIARPITFITDLDPRTPKYIIGDETRTRQVIVNLMGNAIKYTEKGIIKLVIKTETANQAAKLCESGEFTLIVSVKDTGKGIKESEIPNLFREFTQLDREKNKSIIGTGLGLSISKHFAKLMNGDITVNSVYGGGSEFTFKSAQVFENYTPSAFVRDCDKKKVLILESRMTQRESIEKILNNLQVKCDLVANISKFSEKIELGGYTHVLVQYANFEAAAEVLKRCSANLKIAALTEVGNSDVRVSEILAGSQTINLPLTPTSVSSYLNGVEPKGKKMQETINFIAPNSTILIVDDVQTNIVVAKGLIAPYEIKCEVASSGFEAIAKAKKKTYDLILLDHMMPELDGIEAMHILRSSGYVAPVIACTANAIYGAEEMFKDSGFDDVLAKPIETQKLDELLEKFIPDFRKKQMIKILNETSNTDFQIPNIQGMNSQVGFEHAGGSVENYINILKIFSVDAENLLEKLSADLSNNDMDMFRINIHAIKSSSAGAGAMGVSEHAFALENAIKEKNFTFIDSNFPAFHIELSGIVKNINKAFPKRTAENKIAGNPESILKVKKELLNFVEVAQNWDSELCRESISLLENIDYNKTGELEEFILKGDFDDAIEFAKRQIDEL